MGLFDKLAKKLKQVNAPGEAFQNVLAEGELVLAPTSRFAEEFFYGEDGCEYRTAFLVNDAFKPAKSHAGEVEMLHTYAPDGEYGEEDSYPYLAIQCDDPVYAAVEEFKEGGAFTGALELTPLSGKFYFKAKMEYFGGLMYFYGMDCYEGYLENQGLCLVYPRTLAGTEAERKLMAMLDEAALSYRGERTT